MSEFLKEYFCINKRQSTLKREIIAGATNYFTLIYIVLLVPEVLIECFPNAVDSIGEINKSKIIYNNFTAEQMLISLSVVSFIITGISSILVGILTNLPLTQGPSLVIAVFISNTICKGLGYSYSQALAIVFVSGILFYIISATGIEKKIHNAIPINIRYAITTGIGFMIIANGLNKAHILKNGELYFDITVIIAVFTIILIVYMLSKGIHAAIFIGKVICILIALYFGIIKNFDFNIDYTITATALAMDFKGISDYGLSTLFIIIVTICIMDIFETMSVFIALHCFTDLSHKEYKNYTGILETDSITTSIGALMGITNISTYAESTAGIIEGGRTGLTAVISGILFIATVPFTPLVAMIPSVATATTLICAGIIMSGAMKRIKFDNICLAVPSVMTIIIMPLTGSVLAGIGWGMIMYVLINIFTNKKPNIYTVILSILLGIMLFFLPL